MVRQGGKTFHREGKFAILRLPIDPENSGRRIKGGTPYVHSVVAPEVDRRCR